MTEPTPSRTYEVRINGLVPASAVAEELLEELGDVEVTGHDVTTVLSGWFPDELALAEFLRRLRGYGLEVVEIRRVAGDDESPPEHTSGPTPGATPGASPGASPGERP